MYSPGTLAAWGSLAWLNGSFSWLTLVIVLLIFSISVLYLNQVFIQTEALPQRSVLPAFLLVVAFVSLQTLHFPLAPVLGFLPALYVLGSLLNTQRKVEEDVLALKTGLALGFGLLFDYSIAPFVIFSLLVFLLQISSGLRVLGLHLFGVGLPLVGVWVYSGFLGGTPHLVESVELFINESAWLEVFDNWVASGALLFAAFFVFSFLKAVFFTRLLHAQVRTQWILFFWLLASIISAMLAPASQGWASWMYILPVVAFFGAQEVMLTRSFWLSELKLWLFVAGSFLLFRESSKHLLPMPKEETIVQATNTLYVHGTPAGLLPGAGGPYFHPHHAQQLLGQAHTPKGAKRLYLELLPDKPYKVYDSTGLFYRAIQHVPLLGTQYKVTDNQTVFIRD